MNKIFQKERIYEGYIVKNIKKDNYLQTMVLKSTITAKIADNLYYDLIDNLIYEKIDINNDGITKKETKNYFALPLNFYSNENGNISYEQILKDFKESKQEKTNSRNRRSD